MKGMRLAVTWARHPLNTYLFTGDVPQAGLAMTGMVWTKPNAPVGQTLSAINSDHSQRINQPIGLPVAIQNGSEVEVVEHWQLGCCLVPDCDEATDFITVTNSFNAVGVRIGDDSVVNMGDSTMSNMLPRGTMTPIMGRFVADTINLEQKTMLPVGGHTEWEHRPLVFDANTLSPDDQIQCRPLGLDGYTHVPRR